MSKKTEKLESRIADLQSQLNAERRKEDNRKKILYGVALLKGLKDGLVEEEFCAQLINYAIHSKSDREFLGLPPKVEQQSSNDNRAA